MNLIRKMKCLTDQFQFLINFNRGERGLALYICATTHGPLH